MSDAPNSRVQERRIHERVHLRDVAAALPADTLVDVVGRAEYVPDGPRRYDNVEHVLVLEPDAYAALKAISHFPRRSSALAPVEMPRPRQSGLTAADLERQVQNWADRAERHERLAEEQVALGLPSAHARGLAELCRQAQSETAWAARRLAGDEDPAAAMAA